MKNYVGKVITMGKEGQRRGRLKFRYEDKGIVTKLRDNKRWTS